MYTIILYVLVEWISDKLSEFPKILLHAYIYLMVK